MTPQQIRDQGRLLFLTHFSMRMELAGVQSVEDVVALDAKHSAVLEIAVSTAQNAPEACAVLEPMAVAIILSCPDLRLYNNPLRVLQTVAIIGRSWREENDGLSEETAQKHSDLLSEFIDWAQSMEDAFQNDAVTPELFQSSFSGEFLEEMEDMKEEWAAAGLPDPRDELQNIYDDAKLKSIFDNLDPDDYN